MADDHEIFREGFKLLLRGQDQVELIGEAADGEALMDVVNRLQPDLVITDITMPGMDGIEACRKIRAAFPSIEVIALSMFNDESLVTDMIEAGANGYLLKNTNKEELILAVQTVHDGGNYYSAETSMKLAGLIARARRKPEKHHEEFSVRETEILQLICEQLSTKEIAAQLNISVRTVEGHRENIQRKAGARNMIGVVIYAISHNMYKVKPGR